MTYISWFNSFTLYIQEQVMYELYAFDYESVDTYNFANHHMTTIYP